MIASNGLTIFGASGHGKVILDCCRALGIEVKCFADKDPAKVGELHGVPVILEKDVEPGSEIIIGIGDNKTRKKVADHLNLTLREPQGGVQVDPVIHPTATIASAAKINSGTVIFHHAVVQTGTRIGSHCIINTSASIDHDCNIGDFVHIAPNATLCGGITVGEGALVGAGATVIPNIKIGSWATIAAGSVITKDIPDGALVAGNPGRVMRRN